MLTYDDILSGVERLSVKEKAQLLIKIGESLSAESIETHQSKRSLLGIWQGQTLSSDDLDEARQDLWQNFPREDI